MGRALSQSALYLFENNKNQFYIKYMAKQRHVEQVVNDAMKLGSSADCRIKNALQKDLGLKVVAYPIDNATLNLSIEAMEVFKSTGEYDKLLDRLKEARGKGGSILMEHKLLRKVSDFEIIGYLDLAFSDHPNGVYHILDFKVSGFFASAPPSPAPPYSRSTCTQGKTKVHPDFVKIGDDSWCHIAEKIQKQYNDQIYLYSQLINMGYFREGNPYGGIVQILPNRVAVSFGKVESDIIQRFIGMNEAIKKRHIFTEMSYKDNLDQMELLETPAYQALYG